MAPGRPNLTVLHQAVDLDLVEQRRDAAVAEMRLVRRDLLEEVATMSADEAFAGDEWAPMHVLWHLADHDAHLQWARSIVEDGVRELPVTESRSSQFRQFVDAVVRYIDECGAFSLQLSQDQLALSAGRANRRYYVIGMVESTAEHLRNHLGHIRQIRSRLAG